MPFDYISGNLQGGIKWNKDADLLDISILHLTGLSCYLAQIGERITGVSLFAFRTQVA